MKICFKCGAEKPFTEFYKHSGMTDGYLGKCKTCAKEDVILNRKKNLHYYRKYDRLRGNRQSADDVRRYRASNPEKYKAHNAVKNAVKRGKLKKEEVCSNKGCDSELHVVAHHDDYSKPLTVRWLCQACHVQWHKDNLD